MENQRIEKPDYVVNPNDISENFWGHTYLVHVTSQGISYLVNASCEGDALDETMDFITEVPDQKGLYYTPNDPEYLEDENTYNELIVAGNYGYKFTSHNVYINEV